MTWHIGVLICHGNTFLKFRYQIQFSNKFDLTQIKFFNKFNLVLENFTTKVSGFRWCDQSFACPFYFILGPIYKYSFFNIVITNLNRVFCQYVCEVVQSISMVFFFANLRVFCRLWFARRHCCLFAVASKSRFLTVVCSPSPPIFVSLLGK